MTHFLSLSDFGKAALLAILRDSDCHRWRRAWQKLLRSLGVDRKARCPSWIPEGLIGISGAGNQPDTAARRSSDGPPPSRDTRAAHPSPSGPRPDPACPSAPSLPYQSPATAA